MWVKKLHFKRVSALWDNRDILNVINDLISQCLLKLIASAWWNMLCETELLNLKDDAMFQEIRMRGSESPVAIGRLRGLARSILRYWCHRVYLVRETKLCLINSSVLFNTTSILFFQSYIFYFSLFFFFKYLLHFTNFLIFFFYTILFFPFSVPILYPLSSFKKLQ